MLFNFNFSFNIAAEEIQVHVQRRSRIGEQLNNHKWQLIVCTVYYTQYVVCRWPKLSE